ncbi:MAG: hypothetical protein CMQ29_15730 [Gammaproteobacteria bacterium]|jgi:hypothetical protein|nr:hypothetical protein [Gammaproteobacteria bacterium]|tara:strand:- start:375 stop:908 length:534 start_codon:yes stop_codon:yes gene_type:complete
MSAQAPIWRATLAALVIAALLLLTVVLPAEFDIDPLGAGALFGIRGLSVEREEDLKLQRGTLHSEQRTFVLAPFESLEYKYQLAAEAGLIYEWCATGEVVHDFHAEPDGAEAGFAVSFAAGRDNEAGGVFIAPFAGLHGWFWENRSGIEVQVQLKASGYFIAAKEYTGGQVLERAFE